MMRGYKLAVIRQYAAAFSAGLSVFVIGNWIAWTSSAVKKLLAEETTLVINSEEVSWAVALLDFGNFISPIPASFISDRFGRKLPLVILSFVLLMTWMLAIFGYSAYYLYAARMLVGICKGLAFTIVPIYMGEIASTAVRGGVGTVFGCMLNYGVLYELCIGPLVSYNVQNIISSPFPILFFFFFIRFPESPYFYLMKGRLEEAKKSLAWFRNLDEGSPTLEQELKEISANVEEDIKQKGNYLDLVRTPGARRAMVIAMGFAIFQRLSGISCIIGYSAVTLPHTGGYFSPEVYMFFFGITMIVGQSICSALVDKLGRRPLMIISCIGCSLSTGVSGLFYWLNQSYDLTAYNWVPYFFVIFYALIFTIGLGTIPPIILVELFSIDVRSYAASISAIFYAVGSFMTNKLYLHIQFTYGVHYMYLFFTVNTIICLLLTCTIYFETNGKTFSEIQSILKNINSDSKTQKI